MSSFGDKKFASSFLLVSFFVNINGFAPQCSTSIFYGSRSLCRPFNPVLLSFSTRFKRPSSQSLRMIDVGDLFKGAYPPPENILKSVESAGRRVTGADVASAAGVSLNEAQKSLSTLAMLTGGTLEVSKDGEIVYVFDQSFRNTLRARSAKQKLREAWDKIAPTLLYLMRVSFGVALVASIALIFTSIVVISTSSSRSDNDRRESRRNSGGGGSSFMPNIRIFGPSSFDPFIYDPIQPWGRNRYYDTKGEKEGMSFLEAVFSFIFGDGDPNARLEERRTRIVAQMIRRNGGVATAEMLAPYLEPSREYAPAERGGGAESPYVDESFVLPAVVALRGDAQVTDDGDIVYLFDELTSTAAAGDAGGGGAQGGSDRSVGELREAARELGLDPATYFEKRALAQAVREREKTMRSMGSGSSSADTGPGFLEEEKTDFSLASGGQLLGVGALAAVNLFGALYLWKLFATYDVTSAGSIVGFVHGAFPALLVYAVSLVVVPLIRFFTVQRTNAEVEDRNRRRSTWANAARLTRRDVERKLAAGRAMIAKRIGPSGGKVSASDVVYSTGNEVNVDLDELRQWDKSFGGGGGGGGEGGQKK